MTDRTNQNTSPEVHSIARTSATDIARLAAQYESRSPQETLHWALGHFGSEVALATGFGVEGCVLIDMLAHIDRKVRIFYLDTDLHFPETYALIRRLELRYGITFERRATELSVTAQEVAYGAKLWERQPDLCCGLRKIQPLVETLAGLRAWITSIRRDQSAARADARVIEHDRKFGLIKINPLAHWSSVRVWDYVYKHDVPYNLLHDRGFPSIGCTPCTSQVGAREDPRAGRWRGRAKTECGLHQ